MLTWVSMHHRAKPQSLFAKTAPNGLLAGAKAQAEKEGEKA